MYIEKSISPTGVGTVLLPRRNPPYCAAEKKSRTMILHMFCQGNLCVLLVLFGEKPEKILSSKQ